MVRGPVFPQLADAGAADFLVVLGGLPAALELAGDRLLLIHEKHHDVDGRLAKMDAERSAEEFPPQGLHLVHEQLQTLDLHMGPGEAVENDAIAIRGLHQFAKEQSDHLAVAHHAPGVLQPLGVGRVQQRADDNGRAGQAAGLGDEVRVGALAGPGRAAQQDDLLGEAQVLPAEVRFDVLPDGPKDNLGVLDFEVG